MRVFCELDTEFDIGERGWLRVANWNMTEQLHCPKVDYRNVDFKLIDSPERLCARETLSRSCSTVRFYTSNFYYNKICGRVIGRKYNTTDGFNVSCGPCTIDDPYLDGVSITYEYYKKHIWSFAAHECNGPDYAPPAFVGNNYFCDSSDKLWSDKFFCTNFSDQLLFVERRYIDVRVCTNTEDVRIQLVELYVQ